MAAPGRHPHPGNPAAEHAWHRGYRHPRIHVLLERVQLSADACGTSDVPGDSGAIQFISYEQVLWGQMAAATIVSALPQLLLSLMVQKYIVRGLTMGAVR